MPGDNATRARLLRPQPCSPDLVVQEVSAYANDGCCFFDGVGKSLERRQRGSASVKRDLPGALACDGVATRPRVVESGTVDAGAQLGQDVIAVRGARYPCVQP